MENLDRLKSLNIPFSELLGIRFTSAALDRVTGEMTVRPELGNPAVLHGGAIMAFADTLGAAATILNLPKDKATTTIESKTNFVAPARVGSVVVGETTPVHRGRRTMVWQTRIFNQDGKQVALVTQTQIVLERGTT